jgi:predicted nucleotide-binding protein (sugar kinase/HSP70/actin superfamily)
MWTHFLRSIGCHIITSPETNRQILERGIQHSIDENCLAVKVFLGHVEYLIGKSDYVFIPRIVSLFRGEKLCVKLFALADIVRNTFEDCPILEFSVDVENHEYEWIEMMKAGLQLNRNPLKVLRAYRSARAAHIRQYHTQLEKQLRDLQTCPTTTTRVLLVAHPYITHDAMFGKTVVRLLEAQGAGVVYADIVEAEKARELSSRLSTDIYWTYNKELLGAIEYYRNRVDGIIFLIGFPCGPDALVTSLCQHKINDLPLCVIVMDELQGYAGLKTRLESFVDILRLKKEKQT